MIRLTLDNIVETLIELVPEFQKYEDFGVFDPKDGDERFLILGVFGRFFTEQVKTYPEDDSVIQKVYHFLNEQFNKSESDQDALDRLGIYIFDELGSTEKSTEVSKKLLKGKALEAFNKNEAFWCAP